MAASKGLRGVCFHPALPLQELAQMDSQSMASLCQPATTENALPASLAVAKQYAPAISNQDVGCLHTAEFAFTPQKQHAHLQ